jgi:hypothetical protein
MLFCGGVNLAQKKQKDWPIGDFIHDRGRPSNENLHRVCKEDNVPNYQ